MCMYGISQCPMFSYMAALYVMHVEYGSSSHFLACVRISTLFPLGENPPSFPPTLCNPSLFSVCQNSFYPQVFEYVFLLCNPPRFPPRQIWAFPPFLPPFFRPLGLHVPLRPCCVNIWEKPERKLGLLHIR